MINSDYINELDTIYANDKSSIVEIRDLPYLEGDPYDFFDEKDFARYITDVERMVRMSYEYRTLINYLKNVESMNTDTFVDNLTNAGDSKISIEIHHTPLSLYDICSAVIKKRLRNNEDTNIFLVSNEVLYLHYLGWVGLIPVSKTTHELIHNSYIFVPTYLVRGNYKAFVTTYYDYISPEVIDAIDNAEIMTKEYLEDQSNKYNQVNKQMNIFNIHQTYINTGVDKSITYPKAKDDIKHRIDEIKAPKKLMYEVVREDIA